MNKKINKEINNVLTINGYPLDENQKEIVLDNTKHLLVTAGAGSGKSLTIIGKIRFLIEIKKIKEDEIICISFTNDATNNLKNKLKNNYNYNIPCYTFHKLGLEILKKDNYKISQTNTLNYIINEYFESIIYIENENIKKTLNFLNIKYNNYNYIKKYKNINKLELEKIKKLIETFINLFKSNNNQNKDFIEFLNNIKENNKKIKTKYQDFLITTYYIYYIYQKELLSKKEIDFNDMISLATKKVNENGYYKKVKFIIIDEFQDTSKVKLDLIQSILNKTNANLLVVGDDFQSIYKFTGCDLNIFLNFTKIFKESKILKIENTYRNSQELIKLAGNFIMKNKNQLKKNLKSNKHEKYPINIIYYKNIETAFIKLINKIYKETKNPILIIGRNNFDINIITKNKNFKLEKDSLIYLNNKNIKMKYLTAHRSKGLEEENVILINLTNNKLGFPNKIENHEILNLITPKTEKYKYAEERRLFYVAITRTKNKNYLLVNKKNESIFVKELKKDYKKYIKIIKL